MRWKQLFRRKDLDTLIAEMAGENRLRRVLGPVSLTALGIGCIIGAGIFVMTGRAAAEDAGPGVMLSYVVAASACGLAALCYAEFASMAPVAGSAYTYAYATLGEVFAWIIGWDLILEYAMSCACVAAAWANYLQSFLRNAFDVRLPWRLCSDPFTTQGAYFNLPAVSIMAVVTIILIVGIRESAATNAILTLVKLCVVLFVIALGVTMVNQDQNNWTEVPYTQRLSRAEILAGQVISDMVRGDRAPDALSDEELQQVETETAYVTARLAVTRTERNTAELVAKGEMTRAEADAQIAEARARLTAAAATVDDPARFEKVIADVEEEAKDAEVAKWGLLGSFVDPAKLKPIDDATRSNFTPYGFSGIMLGAAIVFFAFIGFDSISTHSEEAINPQRDVPLAIFASLAICTVLYVLVSAVITGMEPYPNIDRYAAIAEAFSRQAKKRDSAVLNASSALIATGALAGMTSVLLVTFLSQARVFLAMARDRLLPPGIFGTIHPRFKTPHISTGLTGLVVCVVAAFTPISKLEEMVNIGTLFAFTVVCTTVIFLRVQHPEMPRPFRCPLVWVVAPLGVLINLTLMLFLPIDTWLRLVVWMALGMAIYFLYGYRHSVSGRELILEISKEGIGPTDTPLRP